MGTAEIIIVFSALMALVALVTIGIDWIGKPLKHRRFIPRMYRFEDEKLPIDEYGHTDFTLPEAAPAMHQQLPVPSMQPAPVVVAQIPPADTVAVPIATVATVAAATTAATTAGASRSTSAFSDSLAATTSGSTPVVEPGLPRVVASPATSSAATSPAATSGSGWTPGMALDATIDDRKPNLATKAQRFWMSTAAELADSHFDADDTRRMQAGKAPSRKNPRTGRNENMQLNGLRRATQPDQVQMSWPEDAIDPWSTS